MKKIKRNKKVKKMQGGGGMDLNYNSFAGNNIPQTPYANPYENTPDLGNLNLPKNKPYNKSNYQFDNFPYFIGLDTATDKAFNTFSNIPNVEQPLRNTAILSGAMVLQRGNTLPISAGFWSTNKANKETRKFENDLYFNQLNNPYYFPNPDKGSNNNQVMFKDGGKTNPSIYTSNPNDPRIQAYRDSLYLYDASKKDIDVLKNTSDFETWNDYTLNWINNYPDVDNAYERLSKYNKRSPSWSQKFTKHLGEDIGTAVSYKKPSQPIIYKPNENIKVERMTSNHINSTPLQNSINPIPFEEGTYFTRDRQSQELNQGKKDYFDKKTGKLLGTYKNGGMTTPSKFNGKKHSEGGIPVDLNQMIDIANDAVVNRDNANLEVEDNEYLIPNAEKGGKMQSDVILSDNRKIKIPALNGKKVTPSEALDINADLTLGTTPDKFAKQLNKINKFKEKNTHLEDNLSKKTSEIIDKLSEPINNAFHDLAIDAYQNQEIEKMNLGMKNDIQDKAKNGGKIHIKKSKVGTFTAAAKKHGKSVQAFASQVLANKDNYSPAMVKKANFAKNASKWHHEFGGEVPYQDIYPGNEIFMAFGGELPKYTDAGKVQQRRYNPTVEKLIQDRILIGAYPNNDFIAPIQHANSMGYGDTNTQFDMNNFYMRHPWVRNEYYMEFGKDFNPKDANAAGWFQKKYNAKLNDYLKQRGLPQMDYFDPKVKTGAPNGLDYKFGEYTYAAPGFAPQQLPTENVDNQPVKKESDVATNLKPTQADVITQRQKSARIPFIAPYMSNYKRLPINLNQLTPEDFNPQLINPQSYIDEITRGNYIGNTSVDRANKAQDFTNQYGAIQKVLGEVNNQNAEIKNQARQFNLQNKQNINLQNLNFRNQFQDNIAAREAAIQEQKMYDENAYRKALTDVQHEQNVGDYLSEIYDPRYANYLVQMEMAKTPKKTKKFGGKIKAKKKKS